MFLRQLLLCLLKFHNDQCDLSPSIETLELLLLPSCFWRMSGFISPCVKLFFLGVHNAIFCCRIAFALPVSSDFTKNSGDRTVLQEAQFQSNTLYSNPFLCLYLFLFFFQNALLKQNAKLGVRLSFPPRFSPVWCLTNYKQSSNPDPNISPVQAKDAPQAAGFSGEEPANCCTIPFAPLLLWFLPHNS